MIDKKKIYWGLAIGGIMLGVIIGRFFFLNKSEIKEAQTNFTPEAIDEVTNGNAELLDLPIPAEYDKMYIDPNDLYLSNPDLMEFEIMSGQGDY